MTAVHDAYNIHTHTHTHTHTHIPVHACIHALERMKMAHKPLRGNHTTSFERGRKEQSAPAEGRKGPMSRLETRGMANEEPEKS